MAFNKDSVLGTMTFTVVLCLVCSFMITGTAEVLKERKLVKKRSELMQNVLLAADIKNVSDVPATFEARVQPMMVDLATGEMSERDNILDFDERMAAINATTSSKIGKDIARIKTRANEIRVFKVLDDKGQLQALVVPVYGKGLWSIMYGFIGVGADLNTITGAVFYEHGETPGIADFVSDPEWLANWQGKQVFNADGKVAFNIVKGGVKQGDMSAVDGVSGATRTGVGMAKAVQFWFGPEGFEVFLGKLKAAGV
ncbi:MAG: Na(+)-translocating NADH-quinone reductase subunit C [Shewanella sp.]|nr:Na(+)-translocating NADH-quinone reductase subunit C [Shewanella sp.]MCF1431194.1 Na(+)-translocating NADH-quinone reductase subunit C [Shewanella sp.]MCF1438256.1 Na(+)-translocating NADH-quinone reductase subunit C [Shewanella sp.]MCF1456082.1 Na(+)-translocating NADH-quinone reductase subunit C [Shewanella sp.]